MQEFTNGYLLQTIILVFTVIIIAFVWIFRPKYLADKTECATN